MTLTGVEQAGNEAYNLAILNLIALPLGMKLGKALEAIMENLAAAVYGRIVITSLDDTGTIIVDGLLGSIRKSLPAKKPVEMIDELKSSKIFYGWRGKLAANIEALFDSLGRVAQLEIL